MQNVEFHVNQLTFCASFSDMLHIYIYHEWEVFVVKRMIGKVSTPLGQSCIVTPNGCHQKKAYTKWNWSQIALEATVSDMRPLRIILCFLTTSLHGAKNSCFKISSTPDLFLGFIVRHFSIKSNKDLGTFSKNSGLFVWILHQLSMSQDCKYRSSSNSCNPTKEAH